MGNNIYVLLTGLWPFYEDRPYEVVQHKILHHERPFIDERIRHGTYIEHKLVEIMERMWAHKPEDRPTIFEVVDFLREVKRMNQGVNGVQEKNETSLQQKRLRG